MASRTNNADQTFPTKFLTSRGRATAILILDFLAQATELSHVFACDSRPIRLKCRDVRWNRRRSLNVFVTIKTLRRI